MKFVNCSDINGGINGPLTKAYKSLWYSCPYIIHLLQRGRFESSEKLVALIPIKGVSYTI